jgi:hypothetical protein
MPMRKRVMRAEAVPTFWRPDFSNLDIILREFTKILQRICGNFAKSTCKILCRNSNQEPKNLCTKSARNSTKVFAEVELRGVRVAINKW